MDYIHDPWYRAIYNCTACLRNQNAAGADICLAYLNQLEEELLNPACGIMNDFDEKWNRSPENSPSSDWYHFVQENRNYDDESSNNDDNNNMMIMLHGVLHQSSPPDNYGFIAGSHPRLNIRRVLARILTSQSEVYAMKATYFVRKEKDWTLAITSYESAISKIRQGLEVTDTAISQWWGQLELVGLEGTMYDRNEERTMLEDDAGIIIVALESMTDRRNKLIIDGKREESRLIRALTPQWETRDVAKKKYGEQRWNNNPNPKNDYSRLRKEAEQRLRVIQNALKSLEELDPQKFLQQATDIKQHLLDGQRPPSYNDDDSDSDIGNNKTEQRRYNSMKPATKYWERRVSMEEYPNPEELGWTFTGSWREVAFYEQMDPDMGLMKLDWYFTTATIKTSLDHPVQGKTQLFAKQCSPSEYLEVLLNPRVHTGNRYHRKPRSNHS